jgi:hypothetical protein
MSALFNHAIRYEWLEQGRNPILFVRQSAKRQRIPECLEPEELRLSQLDRRFRVMVLLDAGSGLRRSELLALKWSDVDFDELEINVRRPIYWQLQDRRPLANLCPWTQSLPPSSGPGNKTAPTDSLMIGCSQALVLAAETLIGRITGSRMSFARQPCEPGSEST